MHQGNPYKMRKMIKIQKNYGEFLYKKKEMA